MLEDGASKDGFMNTECMNVLLQDWSKSEKEEQQGLFETYTFTPIVGSCQTKKNAVDVFDICRRQGPLFDPIMFDCKYMVSHHVIFLYLECLIKLFLNTVNSLTYLFVKCKSFLL